MAIKGKVVVITGASSGIGEATAKLLAEKGAKLVLAARHADQLKQLVGEIKQAGGNAIYQVTDVSKRDDNESLITTAKDHFGKVDVTFLNAGVMPVTPLSALEVDRWVQTVNINLIGVMYGIASVLPTFKEQGGGQIITTSSLAGLSPYPGVAAYCATKFGVRALMESLQMESAQEKNHIRTTTIYPGAVATNLMKNSGNDSSQAQFNKMLPEQVANAVVYAIDQPESASVESITVRANS